MAAIFDLPFTQTWETIYMSHTVLLDLENERTHRKFGVITFDSLHPIHIRSDGRYFDLLRAWLEIV